VGLSVPLPSCISGLLVTAGFVLFFVFFLIVLYDLCSSLYALFQFYNAISRWPSSGVALKVYDLYLFLPRPLKLAPSASLKTYFFVVVSPRDDYGNWGLGGEKSGTPLFFAQELGTLKCFFPSAFELHRASHSPGPTTENSPVNYLRHSWPFPKTPHCLVFAPDIIFRTNSRSFLFVRLKGSPPHSTISQRVILTSR